MEIPRRVLHRMLRANFDYPFVKFAMTDDDRPMLVTELPASAVTLTELARGLVRLMVVADRLLEETASFATSVARASVVRARCQPGDALRPLSGLTDVIPKLLELRGAAGCEPTTLERLARLGEIEERGFGEPAHVPESGKEASDVRRGEMREAVLDLFAAVSQEQTLVVQIDDFQWSDPALGWLWDSVLAFTKDQRVLWCFGARVDQSETMELVRREGRWYLWAF